MLDFEKRKEKSVLNSQIHQEENLLNTEQSKFLYEITFNNNSQIKDMQKEIHILKTQMCDILNIFNDKSLLNKFKNKSSKISFTNEKRFEDNKTVITYIDKEITNQLNENMKILNNKLNVLNAEYKSQLDSEIKQIKNELLNHEKLLINLKKNKLDKVDFDKNIISFKYNFDKLKGKNQKKQFGIKLNEDDINNKSQNSTLDLKDLKKIKKEIYSDFETINLKILNELKNQAYDIKSIYQELQTNNKNYIKNPLNTEEDILSDNINNNKIIQYIHNIEKELSKKVNLEHLNFALNAQSQLNEALNSTCQICRMCWDSEGILLENKYIQWSSQNINTALNVFDWESNSEYIKILQKGVYKIVIGLIGLESDKNIIIIFNDMDKIYETESNYEGDDMNDNYNKNLCSGIEKGNVKYIEKYFACVENTGIKIMLIDKNDNNDISEEAFLELQKII